MSSARAHRVRVHPLPDWLGLSAALGPWQFRIEQLPDGWLAAEATLAAADAAEIATRFRGLGFSGRRIVCDVSPALDRRVVRRARTLDARRRRDTSPGFSRNGVRLDTEGRYSLTPETLALRLGQEAHTVTVIDAGCGAGGNSIGFARAGSKVWAIEQDAARLAMARHNAERYGVAERITFLHGDALALVPQLDAELLFVDPPWGQAYDHIRTTLSELPLLAQLLPLRSRFASLWAKVPPSFDPSSVPSARATAFFGVAEGDAHRVKFVLLRV